MKLYVGNLHYDVTQAQLQELFNEVGEVTHIYLACDRFTHKSNGFGFVQMANDEAAQEAIERFNGHSLRNRPMTVAEVVAPSDAARKGSSGTVLYRKKTLPVKDEGDGAVGAT